MAQQPKQLSKNELAQSNQQRLEKLQQQGKLPSFEQVATDFKDVVQQLRAPKRGISKDAAKTLGKK